MSSPQAVQRDRERGLSLFPSFAKNVPILILLELLSVPYTSAPSGVVSNTSLLCCLITIHVMSSLYRITVPPNASLKRRNVPYQMLLLLEKMQSGKQKAVFPTDLARCLSVHRMDCKQHLSHVHLFPQTGDISFQALASSADFVISFRDSETWGVGSWRCSALYSCLLVVSEVLCLNSEEREKKPCQISLLMSKGWEDSSIYAGKNERAVQSIGWTAYCLICLTVLIW